MSEEYIYKLKINDTVMVRDNSIDGYFFGIVRSIDDWKKRIGVVDANGNYETYPYRKIIKK